MSSTSRVIMSFQTPGWTLIPTPRTPCKKAIGLLVATRCLLGPSWPGLGCRGYSCCPIHTRHHHYPQAEPWATHSSSEELTHSEKPHNSKLWGAWVGSPISELPYALIGVSDQGLHSYALLPTQATGPGPSLHMVGVQ